MSARSLSIPLRVTPTASRVGPTRHEPVTGGIPLPRGAATDLDDWVLTDPAKPGSSLPLQLAPTERWPDGSLRWVLVDTQVDMPAGTAPVPLTLERGQSATARDDAPRVSVRRDGDTVRVDTGRARFTLSSSASGLIEGCENESGTILASASLVVTGEDGAEWRPRWEAPTVEVDGPLRALVAASGRAADGAGREVTLWLRLEFHAGQGAVRARLTVRNRRRASHPGGIWELGDAGSIFLKELALVLTAPAPATAIRWSAEAGLVAQARASVRIYQDSSGGDNWASTNHVTRGGSVSTRFRGYEVDADGSKHPGLRAEPSVHLGQDDSQLAASVPAFWQNFPRALGVSPADIRVAFFPSESAEAHELQGGEQKTHECFLLFGPDVVADMALDWCRARPVLHAEPDWYVTSEAAPDFVTASEDDPAYRALVDAAIEGPDTFFRKRELADEYGWRHYGDIYGDHEGVFHKGPTPLMSHYNNQYDPVGGFLYQFWRTGDPRWWTQCQELASHVVDIDIYHTNEDKAAYNQGLFWHTYHYVDAGKATHRTYPTGTNGGGPSSEQNYTTGLMLHHLVTGDTASREAAVGLARFVVDMDDGDRTVFRWLDRGDTGIASASRTPDYQGPGRGSANSVNALLDGHRISGNRLFLEKAEQIIRRCTHPRQDIEPLRLLDPENRWFYTMYLQSLARYLGWKVELGQFDAMYAYGRDVLLHFTRWMAAHERPYLDRPDLLEYPTETWPAQDIRKSEIFDAAARHTDGAEQSRFLERAEFFFDSCTRTLGGMPTRTLARPVVLLLAHGCRRAHVRTHGVEPAPRPADTWEERWPNPEVFVPQKARAMRRAKLLAGALGLISLAAMMAWMLL